MSSPTQDSSTLSAAERRQKRKERILGSADARLEKLLPGSISSSVIMSQDADNNKYDEYYSTSSASISPVENPSEFSFPIGSSDHLKPSLIEMIDVNRVQACVAIGVIFRVLTLLHLIHSILPLWISLSIIYHSYLLSHTSTQFFLPGYVMTFLNAGRINEKTVRYFRVASDALWSFSTDTIIMAFGFLISHIVIFAVNLFY